MRSSLKSWSSGGIRSSSLYQLTLVDAVLEPVLEPAEQVRGAGELCEAGVSELHGGGVRSSHSNVASSPSVTVTSAGLRTNSTGSSTSLLPAAQHHRHPPHSSTTCEQASGHTHPKPSIIYEVGSRRNVWSIKLRVQDQGEDQRRPGKRLYVRTVKHVS